MIRQYFQQALFHLRENPVITWVSLLGTALSICMIMVRHREGTGLYAQHAFALYLTRLHPLAWKKSSIISA